MSDHSEWLKWRQGGIGGSDVMQIVLEPEHRPYGDPWSVWLSKTQPINEDEPTDAQSLGNWLENPIGQWVADELGATIKPGGQGQGKLDWMRCTPDFWLQFSDGREEGLECKLSYKWRQWEDGVPPYVTLQVMWCMAVFDVDMWYVGAFLPMNRKRQRYVIFRDKQAEARLIETCGEWWERHVVQRKEPPIDGSSSCTKGLQVLYPKPRSELIRDANDYTDGKIKELLEVQSEIKQLNAKRTELKNELLGACTYDRGIQGPSGKFTWSPVKARARMDTKRLKEEKPDIWAEYTVVGEPSRQARVTGPKKEKAKKQ